MAQRYYSSTAQRTTLANAVTASATTFTVAAVTGWPTSFPYSLVVDQDTITEEVVEVTAVSGTTLTVVRAVDGTSGVAHSAGATVNHGVSARDYSEPNTHVNATTSVHGIADTSALLTASSTNTLTNKTIAMSGPSSVVVNSASTAFTITQTGTGAAFLVEDSASTDATPFVISASGNVGIGTGSPVAELHIQQSGSYLPQMIMRNTNTDASAPYLIISKAPSDNAITSGDSIGNILWSSSDTGSTARNTGSIVVTAEGSNGALAAAPARMAFAVSNTGGELTERLRIDSAGLITGTGTSLGAWTAYTPTLGGTGWALGNGTATGFYCQIGKVVYFSAQITFGSTSTFGAGGLYVGVPATAKRAGQPVNGRALDVSSGAYYPLSPYFEGTSNLNLTGPSGTWPTYTASTTNTPFTWASSDAIYYSGTYEAA